jgi:ATP-dependent RNA helicase MRH4, mitochondrial
MSDHLSEKGIKNVAMTSQSEYHGRGSNKHLAGFFRKDDDQVTQQPSTNVKESPHVMITTSPLVHWISHRRFNMFSLWMSQEI